MSASGNAVGVLAQRQTGRGDQQIDLSDDLVHTLTPPSNLPAGVALVAYIQARGGTGANYRDNPDEDDPTQDGATPGLGIHLVENNIPAYFVENLSRFRVIQATNGAAGVLNVNYYSFIPESV